MVDDRVQNGSFIVDAQAVFETRNYHHELGCSNCNCLFVVHTGCKFCMCVGK